MAKKVTISCIFLLLSFWAKSQGSSISNVSAGWSATWQPSKLFVENKGQFKLPASSTIKAKVNYAYDEGTTKIYFTPKGLVYSFTEKKKKREREEERERQEKFKNEKEFLEKEREEKTVEYKTDVVSMEWEGANANAEIVTENKSTEYFSYAYKVNGEQKNENYIYGYKKLTYKNLYPHIDVEYVFHPTDGIKYSFILHPGADVSQIKMTYSNKVKLNSNGEIHISTKFDDIIEHAPLSFYSDNKSSIITSKFIKNGKSVTFQVDNYDNSKTLVIDPWVQTPAIPNSHCVWECEKDAAGNVYIIGGDVPMKLLKYNSAGALQWTFVTAYDTSQNDWLGTFATDLAGNSYVTCGSTAAITKVNTAGAQVYSVTGGSNDEYWNIAFNCDQTKLVVGGTRLTGLPSITGSGVIFDINTATGGVTSIKTVGHTTPGFGGFANPDEVRSVTSSYNARYYYLTLDTMGAIDQNFSACPTSSALFKINHAYAFGYKCENYRPQNGNAGIMAIRANKNFVYTQNGKNIHKRDLMTGAILTTATIPGGISTASFGLNQVGNSGIDIDSCGNVYVGSGNSVIKYDANLNQLSSTALPFAVFDVAVSYGGNVIVSGATGTSSSTSRTGYVQSINMSACNPMTLFCCDATICPAGPFCTTAPSITLTPVTPGGTWSGSGVNASGVFDPATAGAGIHTIIYTLACGSDSIQIKVNPCATLSVCQSGGNITASGGTPGYTWQTSTTYTNCSGCFGGMCNPIFCPGVVTTSLTTIATNTNTIAAPATYPLIITDAVGNTYTVTSLGSVSPCSACTPPTLSVTATNSVTCFGASTGSATVTASPVGTYTYTWQPGSLSGSSQSGLAAGDYTVSATSGGACIGTITLNIAQPVSALSASITSISPASCGQNNGSITVTPSGGTSGYTYTWTPSGGNTATASNLASGNYSVAVSDANSCTTTATASISTTSSPTLTVNSPTVCSGNTATLTVSGATTYTWASAATLSSDTGSTVVASPTTTTVYTVTGVAGTCTVTNTATVTYITTASVSVSPAGPFCSNLPATTLSVTSTGSGTWSGTGITNATTGAFDPTVAGAGTYTISYTIGGSCGAADSTVITVNAVPTLTVSGTQTVCTGQVITLSVTTTATTYTWGGPGTFTSNVQNPTINNVTLSNNGTYIVAVTANGCMALDSIHITVINTASVSITPSGPFCSNAAASNLIATPLGGTWNGTGITNTTNGTFNPAIAGVGTYTVTYTIGGLCGSADSVAITVSPTPTATATGTQSVCAGQAITLSVTTTATSYTWSGPGSFTSNLQNPTIANATSANDGTYTVTVSLGNCTATDTISVTVINTSSITITPSATASCAGQSITLTASGATSYTWSTGATTSAITVSTSGTYSVASSTPCGIVSNSQTVVFAPTPTVQISPVTPICPGDSLLLAATGATTYHWSTGSNSTSIYVHNAGTYSVTGTTAGCTSAVASTSVSVIPLVVSFSATPGSGTAPLNVALTNSSVGASGYAWNFGNGGTSTLQNPSTSYPNVGTYTVTLTASVGSCIESYSQIIIVYEPNASIIIPNVFTPNGDGINDLFTITGVGISDFNCIIYDRWGLEMFESGNINLSWDGKTKGGTAAPDGVYYYIINAKGNNLSANTYKGFVTLIR